jgi:hypothetical protein
VTLLTLLLTLIGLLSPGSSGATGDRFYGFSPTLTNLTSPDIARMARGGAGTLRMAIRWNRVQHTENGAFDWRSTDPIVADAARGQMQILPVLAAGTPTWIAPALTTPPIYSRNPRATAEWQAFVSAAVARYGPGGSFWSAHPEVPVIPIRTWEVWNEENGSRTWTGALPSPAAYARLLALADSAINDVDPQARVMVGGLIGTGGPDHSDAASFLSGLYDVPGIRDHFDAVGLHPYGPSPATSMAVTRSVRAVMSRNGDAAIPIWITEIGWASGGTGKVATSLAGQAQNLGDVLGALSSRRASLNVQRVLIYTLTDDPSAPCDWCPHAGMFTAGGEAKPAWKTFVRFAGGLP